MAVTRVVHFLRIPSICGRMVTRLPSDVWRRLLCNESIQYSSSVWRNQFGCTSAQLMSYHPLLHPSSQPLTVNQIHRHLSLKVEGKETPESKSDSGKSQSTEDPDDLEQFKKLSLYEKVKAMYRDYWYVLIPVHLVSSVVFFGSFYYAASSGVDIVSILEKLHFSETVISKLRDSSAGYIAIAYALYKICTPVRYTVTLGGTTWAIKFLKTRGLIKPRRPMKEAKENVQNIISAMKLPEKERQKFLEDKGLPRIGKAVQQASSAVSTLSNKSKTKEK